MAFGIKREELLAWKRQVKNGDISFLTHYWMDERFPGCYTVTKVGCRDISRLIAWGRKYGLEASWIHRDKNYPHFDLFGDRQKDILIKEEKWDHIHKFKL